MRTLRIHSLDVCISCFDEVTKFLLSQLVLLFIALVPVPYTFLSLFLCLDMGFFCFLFFDGNVLLPGYLDIFVYLGLFVWKAAMATPVLLVTLKEDLEILEYVC